MYESPYLPPWNIISEENVSFPVPSLSPTTTILSVISCGTPDGPVTVIDSGLPPDEVQITLNVPFTPLEACIFTDSSSTEIISKK